MTWTAAIQPALLQSAASVGKVKRISLNGRVVPPVPQLVALCAGQCRYFLAKELADHPDHGGCG